MVFPSLRISVPVGNSDGIFNIAYLEFLQTILGVGGRNKVTTYNSKSRQPSASSRFLTGHIGMVVCGDTQYGSEDASG